MTIAGPNEVDMGGWGRTLLASWWLILGLALVGAVAGVAITLTSSRLYDATSAVYIGQTTDANGDAIASLNSNVKAATQLLSSQVVLKEAAKLTGMKMTLGRLRRETTVATPTQANKNTPSIVNLVVLTVSDPRKLRATAAANSLANVLVAHMASGPQAKIALLESQLTTGRNELLLRRPAARRRRALRTPSPEAAAAPPRRPPRRPPTWRRPRRRPASRTRSWARTRRRR